MESCLSARFRVATPEGAAAAATATMLSVRDSLRFRSLWSASTRVNRVGPRYAKGRRRSGDRNVFERSQRV